MDLKLIEIKEKRVLLYQNQSECQLMDFICYIAVLYLLTEKVGRFKALTKFQSKTIFFQMMSYLKEEK
jgi:hypothetical protein